MATTIQTKVQRLLNKFYDENIDCTSSCDFLRSQKYFRFSPGMGVLQTSNSNITFWSTVHGLRPEFNRSDIRNFWNWLYLHSGSNKLSEDDLMTCIRDEILSDGTLEYTCTGYLNDCPYIIRDSLIFALQIVKYNSVIACSIHVASTRRIKMTRSQWYSGPLNLYEGRKSDRCRSWNME